MRNLSGPLLISLIAVGLYFVTGTDAQRAGSVTVRPRVTAQATGMPEVKATVDRNRVPLGDEVTFTLSPAHVIADPHYKVTLYFGDGRRQVLRQPKVVYLYKATGTYTYSVLVETASTPALVAPVVPNVSLLVTSNSVRVNQSVGFTAQLAHAYPKLRFRFVFDDASDTGWQTNPTTTHAYRSTQTYQPYVDIGVPVARTVKQLGGSKRQSIQVTQPSPADKPQRIRVIPTNNNPIGNPNSNPKPARNRKASNNTGSRPTPPNNQNSTVSPAASPSTAPIALPTGSPTTLPQTSPSVAPTASATGSPTVARTTSQTLRPSESPTQLVSGSATPPGGGPTWLTDNWPWWLILLAILSYGGYKAASALLLPRPTFEPHGQAGNASVGDQGLGFDFQMDVDPNLDEGEVKVDTGGGSLIKSQRSSDE